MSEKKITDWCATIWDYDLIVRIRPYCAYLIYGDEIAPDTGRQHYQTFFQLKTPQTFAWVKDMLPGTHLEVRRGPVCDPRYIDDDEHCGAMDYCMKEGAFEQEGQVKDHPGQGHRSDVEAFVESAKVEDRKTMYNKHPKEMVKYRQAYDDIQATFAEPRPNGATLFWLFGSPGTGKTSFVKQKYPAHYDKSPSDCWWPGYQQQDTVLIDEITQALPFETLLKIGDPGVLRLPIKGGHCVFGAQRVFITSNIHPQDVYPRDFQVRPEALLRRCRFYQVKRGTGNLRSVLHRVFFNAGTGQFNEIAPYERVEFQVGSEHVLLDL